MALALLCACNTVQDPANPVPDNSAPPPVASLNPVPSISSLTPGAVAAGSPMFTLVVAGSDFVTSSTVNWNGVALPTTYVSASELTAAVPATDVANVGDPSITVITPGPGGGTSNAATFTINASNPVPSISSLAPTNAASGNAGFTLTVSGSDFVAASSVNWNGASLATSFVSASQLTARVPAADITNVGSAAITVVNPVPGGGTSNALSFTINASNPLPSISALSPMSAASGNATFTLTVSGSDFVASSVVRWNAIALTTTFVSASQLSALVPAADIAAAGSASISVVNPAPGGGTSNTAIFTINASNPRPSISALSPGSAASGSTAFTLTVSGSDFVASSAVRWNGVALATTYVSASQLAALVPASDITTAGTSSVTVFNPAPGGGTSNAEVFTINASNPLPSISSLSPTSVASGSTAFALTVSGSDFVASSAVRWNGVALATTYLSASQLTALVPASDITTAGTSSVTVFSPAPGGGTSNAEPFTINASNPLPSISSLSPTSVASGSTAFTLTVSGSDFVPASTVNWNAVALTTTYVSAAKLTALVPASDITTAGTASVTVVSPAPGGGTSNAEPFTINASNPVPSISSLSPTSVASGSVAFTLTVNGSDFVASSAVRWNGVSLTTTYVGAATLTALVPASDITTAGTASVTVFNPAPGGGTSNAEAFTIKATNPVPSISSLSPASTTAGDAGFTLTVNGSDFVAASAVRWNGVSLTTTYVSAVTLTALVPASDITTAGTASVTVFNPAPGGGTSNPETFAINASGTGPRILQSGQFTGSATDTNSPSWSVTLKNVQAGSTIYVVGTWPNAYSHYPTMTVTDGKNAYVELDRYDDVRILNLGIQGTQSMGHWYTANVPAGSYTINMAPTAKAATEDWVGVVAFEIAGVSATPLDGHTLHYQVGIPPGTNTVDATVTNTGSSGIQVAVTFDDIDYTAPTVPLVGSGFTDVVSLWDLTTKGFAARAESALVTAAGAHTATFSPQENSGATQNPPQYPDYMTSSAIFH